MAPKDLEKRNLLVFLYLVAVPPIISLNEFQEIRSSLKASWNAL